MRCLFLRPVVLPSFCGMVFFPEFFSPPPSTPCRRNIFDLFCLFHSSWSRHGGLVFAVSNVPAIFSVSLSPQCLPFPPSFPRVGFSVTLGSWSNPVPFVLKTTAACSSFPSSVPLPWTDRRCGPPSPLTSALFGLVL